MMLHLYHMVTPFGHYERLGVSTFANGSYFFVFIVVNMSQDFIYLIVHLSMAWLMVL